MPNYSDLDNEISCTVMIMRTFFLPASFFDARDDDPDTIEVVDYVPGGPLTDHGGSKRRQIHD